MSTPHSARARLLVDALRSQRRPIVLTCVLLTLTLLAGGGLMALAGHFLTAAAVAGALAMGFNLFGPSAGIRGLTFIRILSRYGEKLIGHDATLRIARDLRTSFFARLLPQAPLGLGRHRVGDLLTRLMADIERVDGLLVRAAGPLLGLGLLAIVAVACTTWLLPTAGALLGLVIVLLGVAVPQVVGWNARKAEAQRARARSDLQAGVLEGLEGAADLAALQATEAWISRTLEHSARLQSAERRRRTRLALGTALHAGVAALTLPAMLWLLLDAHARQALSAPMAAGLFFLTVAVLEAMSGVGLAWQHGTAALASHRRLEAIAGEPLPLPDAAAAGALPDGTQPLALSHVSFHWPGQTRTVLHEIDLVIAPGQRIALRGDSGAGKSSLMALLLRLADPTAGQLRYGGVDLRDVVQAQWHHRIAWLPQDAQVLAGSVRENLLLGLPDATNPQLWHVLRQVRLEAHFQQHADGLDAWIGESGITLSAGQSRRLALARALLRPAPLLLLDEPTEGLDVDTAHALLRDLATAAIGRSVVIITHDVLPAGVVDASYRLVEGQLLRDG
ncbi:MAG: thiol reductant ABC exporter subunit CydC [Pseudoxanthomonas sp.]